jgi:glycosyltransferase involved in cell wall biosynthesis
MPSLKSRTEVHTVAILGTYPPRRCGIATFTADLAGSFQTADPFVQVDPIAMSDQAYSYPAEVSELRVDDRPSYTQTAARLNAKRYDVLSIQHEYGIFGGDAGRYLLDLIRAVKMPVVTTLHTVLRNPTPDQRAVMDELLQLSTRVVVMSRTAIDLLSRVHSVDATKIDFIPHGIPEIPATAGIETRQKIGGKGPILLTFGLLSPDKGIEQVINALPAILAQHPEAKYLVVGATHPHVKTFSGETYRESLAQLARDLDVERSVEFVDEFVSIDQLVAYLSATDYYITPYLNPAQITSGTLAYSMGAGKVVISTPYEYAKEVLANGRGILVPFSDSVAISDAILNSCATSNARQEMGERASKYGSLMYWKRVGQLYLDSFNRAIDESRIVPLATKSVVCDTLPQINFGHLEALTDDTGILQHATFDIPNRHEGYCVDDNARALLLTLEYPQNPRMVQLQARYLAFVAHALNPVNQRFRNFKTYERTWLESEGSEDSQGRALWAVGATAARSTVPGHTKLASKLFESAAPNLLTAESPRTWAYSMLGAAAYVERFPDSLLALAILENGAERFKNWFLNVSTPEWKWFEPRLAYANARIPQALILAGSILERPALIGTGVSCLAWLVDKQQTHTGDFSPVGAGGASPTDFGTIQFDQQPIEASSTLSACLTAYKVTHQHRFLDSANRCLAWFTGGNILGVPLANHYSGGCADGLEPMGVNQNQGAESTLAYLAALTDMKSIATPALGVYEAK